MEDEKELLRGGVYRKMTGIYLKWPPPDWYTSDSSFRRVSLIGPHVLRCTYE